MSDCFRGRAALVTGASSGLGEEFARQLATSGCHLFLVARSEDRLAALANELSQQHGVRVVPLACDLSDLDTVKQLCQRIDTEGGADLLVNNAAVGDTGPLVQRGAVDLERLVTLNTLTPLYLTRHFLPGMVAANAGGVLNVASSVAVYPVPFMATYGASKTFLLNHTLALAEELRGSGVRATVLCPGPVRTRFQERAGYTLGKLEALTELPAQQVVARALRAYERGKHVCIPGFWNNLQAHASRLLPQGLLTRIVGSTMRALGRHRISG